MSNNEVLFERFLKGDLSTKEKEALELEIQLNEDLRKEFELFRDAYDLVGYMERREIYAKVKGKYEKRDSKRIRKYASYVIGIVLTLLAVLLFYKSMNFETNEPIDIAQEYFEPYPDRITTMGNNKNKLLDAMSLYNNGDYEHAITKFDSFENDSTALFYLSVSLMATKKFERASEILKTIHNNESHPYSEASGWYLALSQLSLGEKEAAKKILNNIANDSNLTFHKNDASKILRILEQ